MCSEGCDVHLKKSMNSATAFACQLCVSVVIGFEFSELNDSLPHWGEFHHACVLLNALSTDQFVESYLCVFH